MSLSNWRATLVLLVVLVLATALTHPADGSGKNLWTRRHYVFMWAIALRGEYESLFFKFTIINK